MSDNKRVLAQDSAEEVYKDDYHGHPKYITVYILLVVMLVITLIPNIVNLFAEEGTDPISAGVLKEAWKFVVAAIFIFSTWKAILVMRNFMHMKFEPAMLFGIVFVGLLCLVAFFVLVFADVSKIYEPNTRLNTVVTTHHGTDKYGKEIIDSFTINRTDKDGVKAESKMIPQKFIDHVHPSHDDHGHDEKDKGHH